MNKYNTGMVVEVESVTVIISECPLRWFYGFSVSVLVVSCTPSIIGPVLPIAEFADEPSQVHTHAHTESNKSM